jgi:hypothetical protein
MSTILRVATALLLSGSAIPAAQAQDFNDYVLRAVKQLEADYSNGGYDLGSAFTHDIPYADGTIKKTSSAKPPAPSMCVAGVAEVILTAINLYVAEKGDKSPYAKAPLALWSRGNSLSLRANIFMFQGTGSHGTGHTLKRFGMGEELGFDALKPGDFINLNRTRPSGHAVVFLGYLDGNGGALPSPAGAKGFKYFSLQGKGRADAGFGHRYAFFSGNCPTLLAGQVRDCNVIRSSNSVLLNAGRLHAPSRWDVAGAIAKLREQGVRNFMATSPGVSRAAANEEFERELPSAISPMLDGITSE